MLVFPILLVCLAAAFIARSLRWRREAREALDTLEEQGAQLALAEQLSGIGRVCLSFPGPRIRWSEEFCRIAGLDPACAPTPEVLRRILPMGLAQIETTLATHAVDRDNYAVEFELDHPQRGERILRANTRNHFIDGSGQRDQVFMVVRDVTDEYRRIATMEAEKAAAFEQAERALKLAATDPLTGLANRRTAMAALDCALVDAIEGERALALLVFDIDCFKAINDRHGHPVGDRVLRRIADLAQRQARLGVCVARIGGEVFLWLLPEADATTARDAAERLRWAVEAGTALAPVPGATVSVGWAVRCPGDTSLALFSRADAALYAAKRDGRNRVRAAA